MGSVMIIFSIVPSQCRDTTLTACTGEVSWPRLMLRVVGVYRA